MSAWVPTVLVSAIELAIADALGRDDGFVDVALAMNRRSLGSPTYRALVYVTSPTSLLKTSTRVWSQFHSGTQLRVVFERNHARLSLSSPPHLVTPLLLAETAPGASRGARRGGAKNVVASVETAVTGRGTFDARWD
jgi:hypothetical protein